MKAAVIYWSGTGNTETMAGKVSEGLRAAGAETKVFAVSDISADEAADYDVLALGCPSMGVEELEESEFSPFYESLEPKLSGKPVALFGSYGWGDGEWMRTWQENVQNAGAKLVAEGVTANEAPDDEAQAACVELGKKLAE